METEIKKLSFNKNDVLIIRTEDINDSIIDRIAKINEEEVFKRNNITIIHATDDVDFSMVNEEQMNKLGWFKK